MISLLLTIVLLGLLVWAIETFIPMDPNFKLLVRVVAIVFVILWLLQGFGILPFSLHKFN